MTAGCPVRMSEKHLRFVIGPAASGICHVSQVLPYHSQKAPLLAHVHLAPGCHAQCPHYRSRKTARRWIEEQVRSKNKEAKSRIHFGREPHAAREPRVRHP
ncbi:unnamed protein product [Staurois parvus]|uniref:Uncharacterized protein n=1 Tax=Staurois parvus TaxID=386267 RepID=A0ABN9HHF2_9NEOB|nr:unnamed protein product [Staurois parvus]